MSEFDNICTPEAEQQLYKEIQKRNQITVSEFEEFKPLYMKTGIEQLGRDAYSALATKFAQRVTLFHPIQIIQNIEDSNAPVVVLQTLPANFCTCETINVIDQKFKGGNHIPAQDVISAFGNVVVIGNNSNNITNNAAEITDITRQYFAKAQDPDRIKRDAEEFAAITDNLKGKAVGITKSFKWE